MVISKCARFRGNWYLKNQTLEIKVALQILKPVNTVFEAIVDPEKMSNYFISESSGRMSRRYSIELSSAVATPTLEPRHTKSATTRKDATLILDLFICFTQQSHKWWHEMSQLFDDGNRKTEFTSNSESRIRMIELRIEFMGNHTIGKVKADATIARYVVTLVVL